MDPAYPEFGYQGGYKSAYPSTMLGQREQQQLQQPWRMQALCHALSTTPLDVKENHDCFVIAMDTPGVAKDDIKVGVILPHVCYP